MRELVVSYNVWEQMAELGIWSLYSVTHHKGNSGQIRGIDLFTGNEEVVLKTYISPNEPEFTTWSSSYSAITTEISSSDDALALLYGLNPENEQKVQFYTPNYAYKPSWYMNSVFHSASAMVTADSGSGVVWDLSSSHTVVDVSHNNLIFEYKYSQYQPKVYVDGVLKTEKDADSPLGLDEWEMDYSTGRVTFGSAVSGSTITVDYYEVASSEFTVVPDPGTRLKIIETEIQASLNLSIRGNFLFELRGEVGKHPKLEPYRIANGGPYPDGTKLPLQSNRYNSMLCALGESNLSYPRYLKTTNVNPTSRDLPDDIQIFSWDYAKQKEINMYDAWGMDLKIRMENDIPQEGDIAIVTIYATSKKI